MPYDQHVDAREVGVAQQAPFAGCAHIPCYQGADVPDSQNAEPALVLVA
jgi:hypothetical protein